MKRYILTGAPGAGKTSVLRHLELDGYGVVEEAATEIVAAAQARGVAEVWRQASFLDDIVRLQRERLLAQVDGVQFHDRSAVCTAALARHLGHARSAFLNEELGRIQNAAVYERRVFFLRNLGFVAPTEVRRITFEDAVRFEKIHEETYREFGYELIFVERASVEERARFIEAVVSNGEAVVSNASR